MSSATHAPAGKVPQITLAFWIMKICATTLGETGGDLVSMTLKVGYAAGSLILISIFFVTWAGQMASRVYHPVLYWLVILSTSMAGTTISDFIDRTLHWGYPTGAAVLAGLLAITLIIWRRTLGSLAVDHIRSRKVEAFYWTAILISNTLGTALGDFLADSSGLGFGGGALLISSTIGLIVLAHFFTPVSKTVLFWPAFVLTRPLGATAGDLLTKTPAQGGMGLGTVWASAVLAAVFIVLVVVAATRPVAVRAVD